MYIYVHIYTYIHDDVEDTNACNHFHFVIYGYIHILYCNTIHVYTILYYTVLYKFIFLQISQFVAVNRNAYMALHVMRQLKFYVKLMPIRRPIHSNGHSTTRPKHLKCLKVITEHIRHEHHRSPIRLLR
jgi:hypothetical protein